MAQTLDLKVTKEIEYHLGQQPSGGFTLLNMTQSYNLDSQVDFKYAIICSYIIVIFLSNSVLNHVKLTQELYSRYSLLLLFCC